MNDEPWKGVHACGSRPDVAEGDDKAVATEAAAPGPLLGHPNTTLTWGVEEMASESEIRRIARLLWVEEGKPPGEMPSFVEKAKRILEQRDAICCPMGDQPGDKNSKLMPSDFWSFEEGATRGASFTSADCDPAAGRENMEACFDALDTALATIRHADPGRLALDLRGAMPSEPRSRPEVGNRAHPTKPERE